MTLNIRQVSFYMARRKKGLSQDAASTTAGISVRSGRRIEKGQWHQSNERHWRTRQTRWSWVRVVTGGESFTALAERLQEALGQLGGVPQEHRTDSLAAAWKNLSEDDHRDQTEHYAQLCEHYGMTPSRNNLGRGQENGSVESTQSHLKQRIRQALASLQ